MKKAVRFIVVMVALLAFASATVAMAVTEFYVAKDLQGKVSIVDETGGRNLDRQGSFRYQGRG